MIAMQIEDAQGILRDDVLDSDTRGAVKGMGFGSARAKTTNEADRLIPLYHAYDGRVRNVPKYMAPRLRTTMFPRDNNEVPEEYWGKPVWSIDDEYPAEDENVYDFYCRLSKFAPDGIKAEISAAGLSANCRKRLAHGGFPTQFEADEHFRKKHPRRWAAYQRYIGTSTQSKGTDAIVAAVEAMQALAQATANKE